MATSSILGGAPRREAVSGKDTDSLGPSDNSDSGSDAQGAYGEDELLSDSDAVGTGERATAGGGMERPGSDIMPDHIEGDDAMDDDALKDSTPDVDELAADDDEEEEEEEGNEDEGDAADDIESRSDDDAESV